MSYSNRRKSSRRLALAALVSLLSLTIAVLLVLGRIGPAKLVSMFWDHAGSTAQRGEPARAPGFRDVAPQSGIDFYMSFLPNEQGETFKANLYDHGCGVAVADYDGDGAEDVLFLNQSGPNALYRNRGDGTFEDVTQEAGPLALNDRICVGAAFGDYDNDGDQDLYITSTRGGNVLLENLGDGRFRDVTDEAGVGLVRHSQTPVLFDYDNDGDLDLFVTNTGRWTNDDFDASAGNFSGATDVWEHVFEPSDSEFNVLFRNDGGGTFTDVTDDAGLSGQDWGSDAAAFDYDDDGDLDLFVAHMYGRSRFYRNDGHRHFDDVTDDTLQQVSMGAMGCKAFDFDGDGLLDLFTSDMHSDMWIRPDQRQRVRPRHKYRHLQGPPSIADVDQLTRESQIAERLGLDYDKMSFGNCLYHNGGAGRFTEVSDEAGMETWWPWGAVIGDFDSDGHEDVFVPAGMGYPYFYWPSSLMRNNGDSTFTDVAEQAGIEPPAEGLYLPQRISGTKAARSSRCAATADFDGDGRLELMVNNFNDRPYYFKNQFPRRHYVAFRLRGTASNRDAVGAVVRLSIGRQVMLRQVHAGGGYLSQSSKTLHFGLGGHESVDRAEIRWPSGTVQVIESPAVDRLHEVAEPEDEG